MKELDKCIKFLKLNKYVEINNEDGDYRTMIKTDETYSSLDLNEGDIVFLDGAGDWLHVPCNLYALIGALLYYSQIDVGFNRLTFIV